ncbi:MAG: zinc dependent phospholipase C family protein [bacterium]|nr:zinc dependent phospholipase C family protein [bacterium]
MKHHNRFKLLNYKGYILGIVLLFSQLNTVHSWGFYAHQKINRLAVFCLPPEMFGFFKLHIDFISEHAVDPDKRRYLVEGEGVKHYIDMDYYERVLPFDTLPRSYQKAMEKYSKDTLHTYGIAPWNIQWMLRSLTQAFEENNTPKILKYAAEIGHYIGDAHVPLHTTSNYNGQQTNQHGIHGFFESRLPELFAGEYDFFVGSATYINQPIDAAWIAVEGSYAALDSVFLFEKILQQNFKESQKYSFEAKGTQLQKVYSPLLSQAYHKQLDGMVERRMRAAILCVASFWYTAWVNAGQPNFEIKPINKPDTTEINNFPAYLPEKMIGRQEN